MIVFNDAVMRSVKLTSPALAVDADSESDEEDGVIQPEQNRSHQLIESMLSSSPPQPTYLASATHPQSASSSTTHSTSTSPEQQSKAQSSSSSPSSPRSPHSAEQQPGPAPLPPSLPPHPQPPRPAPLTAVPADAALRPPPRLSDSSQTPRSASARSEPSSSSSASTDPASPPPGPRRKAASGDLPLPPSDLRPAAERTEAAEETRTEPAPAPPRPAVDVDAAVTGDTGAALSSPTSGVPRIVVSKSSTLSASMFSKEEVLSPPSIAQQSSLSKELTESGLFRPTRPYSASANSSPAIPYRGVRDAPSQQFASTGGLLSSTDVPAAAASAAPSNSLQVQSASAVSPPGPAAHRRTRSRGHTSSSSVTLLRVFPSVDRPLMQVLVPIHCPVQRVLELVLAQYKEEGRTPPLKYDVPDAYELRVLDDDDGTPDEDMPPLDRHRSIQEYGVDGVAFVEVADYQPRGAVLSPTQQIAQLKASAGQQAMERKMNATHPPPLQTGSGLSSGLSSPSSTSSFSVQSGSRWDEVLSPRSAVLPASSATSPSSSQPPTPTATGRPGVVSPTSLNSRLKVSGGKVQLKVVLADMETHVLLVPTDCKLEDLLPLISRKKSSQMQPEHWKFCYPPSDVPDELDLTQQQPPRGRSGSQGGHRPQLSTSSQASVDSLLAQQAALHSRREQFSTLTAPELDMRMSVQALEQDELRLINKLDTPRRALPSHSTLSAPPMSTTPSPDQFLFTIDTASAYSEYRVVKTNQRGKRQHRMFGIDRHKVYNKHVAAGHRRRISFEVTRAYRPIRSIASIIAQSNRFTIVYHEKGGKFTSREYETETRMECAEIVAKVRFLMQLSQQEHPHQGDASALSAAVGAGTLHLPASTGGVAGMAGQSS